MKAPDFKLPYIDQPGDYQLSDDVGKIVILTFWTSWCPYCHTDMPMKEKLYQTIDSEMVKFLTINVVGREREPDAGRRYHEELITQPTLVDDGLEIYRKYDCQGVPTTVIINQEGEIVSTHYAVLKPIQIIDAIHPLLQ